MMNPGAIPGYFNSFHPFTQMIGVSNSLFGVGGTQAEARRGQKRSFERRLAA